jgi:LysR family transcriptional regulator, hca operon transcriptional activator
VVLTQAEAAKEAARRAAQPAKATFALGFLPGTEVEWMAQAMRILHDQLPNIDVTVSSQYSPDLADALMGGRLDAACMRAEPRAHLAYRRVLTGPFILVFQIDHRLAALAAIELRAIVDETFIIPSAQTAPVLRGIVEEYLHRSGLDAKPRHEVDNMGHAVSMVTAIRAVGLLPAYARNFLPSSVTSRPFRGDASNVDLVVGYNEANRSPMLKSFLSSIEDLATR